MHFSRKNSNNFGRPSSGTSERISWVWHGGYLFFLRIRKKLRNKAVRAVEFTDPQWDNTRQMFLSCVATYLPSQKNWTKFKDRGDCTSDRRFTSLCSLYGQLSQGGFANFPAIIASKSFLWNHHTPQMKWHNLWHILMY